jgi:pyroglutamyl-peptidase
MPKNQKPAKSNPKKSSSNPVTLLLTGFDAFGGDKYNPSQLVVESFPDILKSKARGHSKVAKEIHIRKQILPTAGVKGWKVMRKALDDAMEQAEGPIIVLMLGQARLRQTMSLERFALNFRDYRLPDNNGELRREETIETMAPQLLRTNLNVRLLQEVVSDAGYPCEVSNHAGTFVCNELYFRALNYKRESGDVDSVLFMHLPFEKVFAKSAKKLKGKNTSKAMSEKLKGITKASKAKQVELLTDAIVEVTENIAHEIVSHRATRRK